MTQLSFEPSSTSAHEAIERQQIAYDFSQEVRHREAFEAYCQWYYETAAQHQAELAAMEHDIPLFNWFRRGKSTEAPR
ncbi:hypothetical protein [Leptothoe sp. PORK10 BA2]|uniref:hypothetical protein n=1 Tax=Leptothoe sp. PORK10 BA2 TaxID=3110254 RepID=UPI002B220A19|nr:hypothetical protein [Leptothoe sp. PORK10 BA2]MEA5465767.1 hypothetical protein [Leptothoe sp. PORK10 BA2]